MALGFFPVGSSDAAAGLGHVSFRAAIYSRLSNIPSSGELGAVIALGASGIILGRHVPGQSRAAGACTFPARSLLGRGEKAGIESLKTCVCLCADDRGRHHTMAVEKLPRVSHGGFR